MNSMKVRYIFIGLGVIAIVGLVVAVIMTGMRGPSRESLKDASDIQGDGYVKVVETEDTTQPSKPKYQTHGCTWKWFQVRDLGLWAEECLFSGVKWSLRKADSDTLVLVIDNKVERPVLKLFQKPTDKSIESIGGVVGADAPSTCAFVENFAQTTPEISVYEFAPTGAQRRAFEISKEEPSDPCGPYGISASGQRIFEVWKGHEDTVIFLDYGIEGSLFEYESISFIR